MRTLSRLWLVVIAVGGSTASAEPEKDWLLRHLETSVLETGRIGWDGFAPGTWVQHRITPQPGLPKSERRETLLSRDEKGTRMRLQMHPEGQGEWPKGSESFLARVRPEGVTLASKDLGVEEVEVDGKKVSCTKREITGVVAGKPIRTRAIWQDDTGAVLRWTQEDGDGWATTYQVLRPAVPFQVGERKLACREIRKTSKSSSMQMEFQSTELWCPEVPDFVVRAETTQSMGPQKSTQVTELQAFEAK